MNNLPSNLVAGIEHADKVASFTKEALEQGREAQDYNTAMLNYAAIVAAIAKSGTLGEKVDAAIALQERDVNKAADKDKPTYIQQANDAVTNFNVALNVYDKLTTEPVWYREYAAGVLPKNKPNGLPYDDFRQALASQNSREGNRDTSINNLPGEEALYDARKALLASINRDYQQVQGIVLSGGEPPPGSTRTGAGKGKAGGKKTSQKHAR